MFNRLLTESQKHLKERIEFQKITILIPVEFIFKYQVPTNY